ncbi:hypothetical protein [Hyphomonas sp.]|uniref:hypothetical protein n=1 Tax=Hyphomonas sp. TaxID=87 RepID=UPI0032EEB6BF
MSEEYMSCLKRLLDWCIADREMVNSIVVSIDDGARHFQGPVGGHRTELTKELRAREAETVAYLDRFIERLKADIAIYDPLGKWG